MESRSIAYNSTYSPGMDGMMPGMQGMPEMPEMMYGIPGHPPLPYPTVMERYVPESMYALAPAHEGYVVKRGDSVYKIAKSYGMTMRAIIKANNLQNPNIIYPGQILIIP